MPLTANDTIRFLTDWKIKWADFDGIKESTPISKRFNAAYNNVVLQWHIRLSKEPRPRYPDRIEFYLNYLSGPVEKFKDMEYSVAVVKPDRSSQVIRSCPSYEAVEGSGWGWVVFDDAKKIRPMFGLSEEIELICRIMLKIPVVAFTFSDLPLKTTPPKWMIDICDVINDPDKSTRWNAKFISSDNTVFYCHKIIAFQSKPLEAMFKHPPKEGKPENEYEFPALATESMRAFIKFLYTSQAILGDLSIDHMMELADTAEQYNLKSLKEACVAELGQRVISDPSTCYQIIQLADLHEDMIHLKYRAMDVLAEKFEELGAHTMDLVKEFGGGNHGKSLCRQFALFQARRLLPFFL